jgi:hypothetical protein
VILMIRTRRGAERPALSGSSRKRRYSRRAQFPASLYMLGKEEL